MVLSVRNFLNSASKSAPKLDSFFRNAHITRGKPPGVARNIQQRLEELKYKDLSIHYKVDIGFPRPSFSRGQELRDRLAHIKSNRHNEDLEKLSRNKKLQIDLEAVYDDWYRTAGPYQLKKIAEHYGIFEHLYGDAYFSPRVPMRILYDYNEDSQMPIYYGNIITPSAATKKPEVSFESEESSLWSLLLTNPDGHFTEENSEYLHWFVGNIPGGCVDKGETIMEYLQPFPPRGTGYHRFIFVLYKQDKRIDFSEYKKGGPCLELSDRTFKTLDFYRQHQDNITPIGLSFFQSQWDRSLTEFFHNTLQMREPVYEYDFPEPYIKPQVFFPKRVPFNLYLDKYRDPKQINKEFLQRKLKKVHPFRPTAKPAPYPNAHLFEDYCPDWLKREIRKSRLRWGRVTQIDEN